MPWPLSQDYNEAIQSPRVSLGDPELQGGHPVTNALGMPMPRSGNFADVYEFVGASGAKWAIKCFTRGVPGLRERYSEVTKHLAQAKLPFMVDFEFLMRGIRIRGDWYPVLKMQWVEGFLLNEFVRNNLDKPAYLGGLLQIWLRIAKALRDTNTTHADLQHGNVILVANPDTQATLGVRLIDYDGMWVPALAAKRSGEVGHPAYQHPQRLQHGTYNLTVDRVPLLVVACALRCLMVAGKPLWDRYDNGDNLLFREADLRAPRASALFKDLQQLPDPQARMLIDALQAALERKLEDAPAIYDLLPQTRVELPPAGNAPAATKSATPPVVPSTPSVVTTPLHATGEARSSQILLRSSVDAGKSGSRSAAHKVRSPENRVAHWALNAAAILLVLGFVTVVAAIWWTNWRNQPAPPPPANLPIAVPSAAPPRSNPIGLSFDLQPRDTIAGQVMDPVRVHVPERIARMVPGACNIRLTLHYNANGLPPADTEMAAVAQPVVNAVATFPWPIRICKSGKYNLCARVDGLDFLVFSTPFNVVPATPKRLEFKQLPKDAIVGKALPPVTVCVLDEFGNLVEGGPGTKIKLMLVNPKKPVNDVLDTKETANGVAVFSNIIIEVAGADYKLSARAITFGLDDESQSFNVAVQAVVGPPWVPDWITKLGDSDADVRKDAAITLQNIGENAIPALVAVIADVTQPKSVRSNAADVLRAFGSREAVKHQLPVMLKVVGNARDDDDVRLRVAWVFNSFANDPVEIVKAEPTLLNVCAEARNFTNASVRYHCASMLSHARKSRTPEIVLGVLADWLRDTNGKLLIGDRLLGDFRTLAVDALRNFDKARVWPRKEIIDLLRDLARNEGISPELRDKSVNLLKDWNRPAIRELELVNGEDVVRDCLSAGDAVLAGEKPYKVYRFVTAMGNTYHIKLQSEQFNPYLYLMDQNDKVRMESDGGQPGTDRPAEIPYHATAGGTHDIWVTSNGALPGDFVLTVRVTKPATPSLPSRVAGTGLRELTSNGKPVVGQLLTTDPLYMQKTKLPAGNYKVYSLHMEVGLVYQIDMRAIGDTDPYLCLEDPDGKLIIEDDDGGGGLNAQITYKAAKSGKYRIIATCYNGKIGKFKLTARRLAKVPEKVKAGLNSVDWGVGTVQEAKSGDRLAVNYIGTLRNGKEFDNSYRHSLKSVSRSTLAVSR